MRTLFTVIAFVALGIGAGAAACGSSKGAPAQAEDDAGGEDAGDEGGLPCSTTGLSKGPWSLHVDGTTAVVRWEACREGTPPGISYTPEDGGTTQSFAATETPFVTNNTYRALNAAAPPDYAGTWYMHEADLIGLAPATCYRYGLDVDPSVKARFCTARNSGDEVKWLSWGDTNPGLGFSTANVLSHVIPMNPDFIVHGGDIEYYASLVETYALWFQVMPPMIRQGAFFPAIGNHDTDTQAGEPSDKFEQYTERFWGGPGFDGPGAYYDFTSGGIWFFALDMAQAVDPPSVQFQWLVNRLQQVSVLPGYRFSVVYVHEPFWTCGDTGDDPTDLDQLSLVFQEYKVPLVIQAHMHGYERFESPGLTIVTAAGGGGAIGDPSANTSRAYCNLRVASGAFFNGVLFDVKPGVLSATVIDDQGAVRDSFSHPVP